MVIMASSLRENLGFVSFMHLALTENKGSLGDNGVQGFFK